MEEGIHAPLVRRIFDAIRTRDVETGREIAHDDLEFTPVTVDVSQTGPYIGIEGMLRYLDDVERIWEDFRYTLEEVRERDSVAVGLGRIYARGGGRVIDSPIGWVFELSEGKVRRARAYLSHSDALESAGIAS